MLQISVKCFGPKGSAADWSNLSTTEKWGSCLHRQKNKHLLLFGKFLKLSLIGVQCGTNILLKMLDLCVYRNQEWNKRPRVSECVRSRKLLVEAGEVQRTCSGAKDERTEEAFFFCPKQTSYIWGRRSAFFTTALFMSHSFSSFPLHLPPEKMKGGPGTGCELSWTWTYNCICVLECVLVRTAPTTLSV